MIKAKTNPTTPQWSKNKRARVGDTVIHNNSVWSNATGTNTEPVTGSTAWVFIRSLTTYQKRKIDGLWFDTEGNINEEEIEVGNTFEGWNGNNFYQGKVTNVPFDINDENTFSSGVTGGI